MIINLSVSPLQGQLLPSSSLLWWSHPARTETGWPQAGLPLSACRPLGGWLGSGSFSSDLCSRRWASGEVKGTEEKWGRGEDCEEELRSVCIMPVYLFVDRLTWTEHVSFKVSLNCMVAVTKMASVFDSCFPLERKSLTSRGTQRKRLWLHWITIFLQ